MVDVERFKDSRRSGNRVIAAKLAEATAVIGDDIFILISALCGPCFCQPDCGMGINQAMAEIVADEHAAAIPVPGTVQLPA